MTKEETKEAIKVMQAYVDGNEIESKLKEKTDSEFIAPININWDFYRYEYRVKPKETYRPYKDAEEMDAAIKKHGNYVLGNACNYRGVVMGWGNCTVQISGYGTMTYVGLLNNHRWVDGTPCGVKVDEVAKK